MKYKVVSLKGLVILGSSKFLHYYARFNKPVFLHHMNLQILFLNPMKKVKNNLWYENKVAVKMKFTIKSIQNPNIRKQQPLTVIQ